MSPKKIITVFGATGAQGGAVVTTFLNDPKLKDEWAVRGVTRDTSKEAPQKLAARGVEVVAADVNDKASLVRVMSGSEAVFAVTNYWEKLDAELETQQGKNLADAAKETGVKHYIWSTLLDINKVSGGKLPNVYHFDSKARVEEYIRELKIPATFFMPGYYMSNVSGGSLAQSPPDNAWTLSWPIASSSVIAMYDTADTGKYLKAIVLNKDKLLGERFIGTTAYMTAQEIVDVFKSTFPEGGKTARYYQQGEDEFKRYMTGAGMPDFVALEMYENYLLMQDFGYYGGLPLEPSHKYVEDPLTTWAEHCKKAKAFAELK